jgi:hypothetical protein
VRRGTYSIGTVGLAAVILFNVVLFLFFEFMDSPLSMVALLGCVVISFMVYAGVVMLKFSYDRTKELRE